MKGINKIYYLLIMLFLLNLNILLAQPDISIYQDTSEKVDKFDVINFDDNEKCLINEFILKSLKTRSQQEFVKQEFIICIPNIGNIILCPKVDKNTGEIVLISDNIEKNINNAPVTFNDFKLILKENKQIELNSKAKVFGQDAKIKLAKLYKESKIISQQNNLKLDIIKANFKICFNNKYVIELLPSVYIELNHADLILEKNKPTKIIAEINISGHKSNIVFLFSKDTKALHANLQLVPLGSLIPEFKSTEFSSILLKNVLLSKNLEKNLLTTIVATSDFSSLNMHNLPVIYNNLKTTITISKDRGVSLKAHVEDFVLPVIGKVTNPELRLKSSDLILTGSGYINILDSGTYLYLLRAKYTPKGFEYFGEIKYPVNYNNIIIHNAKFKLDPDKSSLVITGIANIKGFNSTVNLTISTGKPVDIKIQLLEQTLRPFKDKSKNKNKDKSIDLIKDLELKVNKADIDINTNKLTVSGNSKIFGIPVQAKAEFLKNYKDQRGVLVRAKLPDDFKFSSIYPDAKHSLLNNLNFKEAYLLVSDINFVDDKTDLQINRGVNFYSKLALKDNALTRVTNLLANENQELTIFGPLDKNLENIILKSDLNSGTLIDSNLIRVGPAAFEITHRSLASLICPIIIRPSSKNQAIQFTGEFILDSNKAALQTVLNNWINPFGLKGLTLKNLEIDLSLDYMKFVATALPSEFSLKAVLPVGNNNISLRSIVDNKFKNIGLIGQYNYLFLLDILRFIAEPMGLEIPKDKVYNLELKNLEFKLSSEQIKINNVYFNPDLVLTANFDIANQQANIEFKISPSGITARGLAPRIDIGQLSLTGECQGGPVINIELNKNRQDIVLFSDIKLGDLFRTKSNVSIDKDGIFFDTYVKIGRNCFDARVSGKSLGSIKNPNFEIHIEFRNSFKEFVEKEVQKLLNKVEEELKYKIYNAEYRAELLEKKLNQEDLNLGKAEKDTVEAALAISQATLKSAIDSGVVFIEENKHIVKNLSEHFSIDKVEFIGNLKEIEKSKISNMTFYVTLLGKQRKIKFEFDFNNALFSAKAFAENIYNIIKHSDSALYF